MRTYDPDRRPDAPDWLDIDESARIGLALSYHRRARVCLPNAHLHATIHVVVENQIALKEPVVVETLARLQREGLSRHDAVHAIGSVLAAHIWELLKRGRASDIDPNVKYFDELKRLTAAGWLSGEDSE